MRLADKRPDSVVIIGAGIAGLACAKMLNKHSIANQLFEKSFNAGGRMSTRINAQWHCDHGAQYFTAQDLGFISETARWQHAGVIDLWQPRLRVFEGDPVVQKDASATVTKRFVGVPSMRALGNHLAKNITVHFGSTIDELRRSQFGWQVHSKEHGWSEARADAVVLAMPAPQSLALLAATESALSAKVARFTMRPTWALMLRLPQDFDPGFDAAFVNTGALRWMAKDSSKPGRAPSNTWLLHANTQWSEDNIERPLQEVSDILQAEFKALTGGVPVEGSLHLWRYAEAASPSDNMCFWDADIAIGVCGDWLADGKVEGAWKSGSALAREILRGQV